MNEELIKEIELAKKHLLDQLEKIDDKRSLLRSPELRALYERIPKIEPDQRAYFGKAVNSLKEEIALAVDQHVNQAESLPPIDVTAPFAPNVDMSNRPSLLDANMGSLHPLTKEIDYICDIFESMGFSVIPSREIDDDWHMFTSLNFPEGHPARDDYDTFMTEQKDKEGKPWLAPAHTSTMQNRVLTKFKSNLEEGNSIAAILPGRVFRNEDVDARHEHTFYQFEGVFVGKDVNIGNLLASLKTFLEKYYGTDIEIKTQPFYFPFTEPSLEFAISCPFCSKAGCRVCSYSGWIELLGCGMIHPNVLKAGGIDPEIYQGFAWGCGVDRLVMMKHNIEDVRLFESGRLDFLRQFSAGGDS